MNELSLYSQQKIDLENDLVFFDEIQLAPLALNSLKYFNEKLPQLAIVAAGSLLGLHLSDTSFPVGKVDYLYLFPLNFFEFIQACNNQFALRAYQKTFDQTLDALEMSVLWEALKILY